MRSAIFCPHGYAEWDEVLNPDKIWQLEDSYAIHLWNEMWRRNEQDKNASYPPDCLYEQLKLKYLPQRGRRRDLGGWKIEDAGYR
jgi:hypothetical protein